MGVEVHAGGVPIVSVEGGSSVMYQRSGNWVTEFYHDGIRYKKSLGKGISKTVAKEREGKYRQEVREGKHNVKARRIRFETFSIKYLDHARVNKKPKVSKAERGLRQHADAIFQRDADFIHTSLLCGTVQERAKRRRCLTWNGQQGCGKLCGT